MSARKLIFCLLLSVMLTVTFIPSIAFGADDKDVTIDQCGSIAVEGWTMDEEDCSVWNSPDGKASAKIGIVEGAGEIYAFDDNYSHAVIGNRVAVQIEISEDEDEYRASATINGEDCYDETWGTYCFTVAPDDVDGEDRTPGNVLSINCEKIFEDLTEAEKTSANKNVIYEGNRKTVNTTGDKTVTFKFVAPEDGKYAFYSLVDDDYDYEYGDIEADPEGRVLDADGNVIAEMQEDQLNFELYFDAEEGQTYYLQATELRGREVSFDVELVENDIVGISYQPKKPWQLRADIEVHSNSEFDEYGNESEILCWDIPSFALGDKLIVTKKDNSKKTYELVDDEEWDERIFVNVNDADDLLAGMPSVDADDDWAPVAENAVGTSKNVTVSYVGNKTTVPVSFVENPFTDLEIDLASDGVKVERKDASDGVSVPDYYWNWGDTKFVFTKSEGNTDTIEYVWDHGGIRNESENDWIMVEPQEPRGADFDEEGNSIDWEVGETHNVTITVAGFKKVIEVTVIGHKHQLEFIEGYAATCDCEGMKDRWYCTVCEDSFWDSAGKNRIGEEDDYFIPINPNNHEYLTETPEVPAIACQKDGTAAYWTCDACGKMFSDKNGKNSITKPVTIPKHKTVKIAAKAATYKTTGNKEYYQCSACKKYFGDAAGASEIAANSWIIAKLTPKAQPVSVKAAVKTVKVKKLKKKAIKVTPLTVKNAKGTLSYKVVGGNAKSKKALKVNAKNGKVTVKKKTKKGKYTIKVKVTAAATASGEYNPFTKTVKVTVKVK